MCVCGGLLTHTKNINIDHLVEALNIGTFSKGGIKNRFRLKFHMLDGQGCGQVLSEYFDIFVWILGI